MDLQRLHQTTNLADRSRFVWMWSTGMSARAIAQETGASVTTICRWIRRWRREGHINTRPRRGRPRKNATSSALRIQNHCIQFPSFVPGARELDTHTARTFAIANFEAKTKHVLPLTCLSALISFQYFQNLYTAGYQLLLADSRIKVYESSKPLLSPELNKE